MECLVCNGSEWENVDEFRLKPSGMEMCTGCGFITYPKRVGDPEALKTYYEAQYRNAPGFGNKVTGNNKIWYHQEFLTEVFQLWKDNEVNPKTFEVGCAFGMTLNWMKKSFPKGDIRGSELTKSFVNVAWNEYGLELKDDFDDEEYDLIFSYKVAEHQPNVVEELKRYKKSLEKGGYLYIGVPCWFNKATNFGSPGFDLEYYYHPDHVNVWRREQFEYLLNREGFRVIKENHVYYDSVYLCKVDNSVELRPVPKFSADVQKTEMAKLKEAWIAYEAQDYKKAIETYPRYPMAWKAHYSLNRQKLDESGEWEKVLMQMLEVLPDDSFSHLTCIEVYFAYKQWDKALEHVGKMLELSPQNAQALEYAARIYGVLAVGSDDLEKRNRYLAELKKTSVTCEHSHPSCTPSLIEERFKFYSKLPKGGN
jgi:SAM-dependent methyltransferase